MESSHGTGKGGRKVAKSFYFYTLNSLYNFPCIECGDESFC